MDARRLRSERAAQQGIERVGATTGFADAATDPRADDAVAGPAQQADRLRTQRIRSDREGSCVRDPAKTRRRKPDAGGHSCDQDRVGSGTVDCVLTLRLSDTLSFVALIITFRIESSTFR